MTVFEVDSQNSNPKKLGYISFSVGEYQTVYNYQKGYQDKYLTFQISSSTWAAQVILEFNLRNYLLLLMIVVQFFSIQIHMNQYYMIWNIILNHMAILSSK